jgi:hypothetical protein
MNGCGNTRLLFRFENESVQQYNVALYELERARASVLSTHFESGSHGTEYARPISEDGAVAADSREVETASHAAGNTADHRSASEEPPLRPAGETASDPRSKLLLSTLRIGLLFCFTQLIQTIIKQFLSYYQHIEHNLSIFQKCGFFNSSEQLGILLGFPAFLMIGLHRSLWASLVLAAVPALATLYLVDRNGEYQLRLSAESQQHEAEQA